MCGKGNKAFSSSQCSGHSCFSNPSFWSKRKKIEILENMLECIQKEEQDIKEFETKFLRKILDEEKRIERKEERVEKLLKRLYRSVNDWKIKIWNNCEEKKIVDSGEEIIYQCNILNKVCNFDDCLKNKI